MLPQSYPYGLACVLCLATYANILLVPTWLIHKNHAHRTTHDHPRKHLFPCFTTSIQHLTEPLSLQAPFLVGDLRIANTLLVHRRLGDIVQRVIWKHIINGLPGQQRLARSLASLTDEHRKIKLGSIRSLHIERDGFWTENPEYTRHMPLTRLSFRGFPSSRTTVDELLKHIDL